MIPIKKPSVMRGLRDYTPRLDSSSEDREW